MAELPITELLQRLRFTGEQEESVSVSQLHEFVKLNRAGLRALGIDLTSTARKTLMPILIEKIPAAPSTHTWVVAPPRALTGPTEQLALPPPPAVLPAPEQAGRASDTSPARPARPDPADRPDEISPARSTPEKPPDKRPRA